ncbi:unnamed protein product [Oikopleura dioica]|uniref:Uncharacterized protein n=1 Tax=Oikopleura dioica TaxID=34765 RepID=E4XEK0_OIKDI|nr:unnamed protein product [Oikopleura dioica]
MVIINSNEKHIGIIGGGVGGTTAAIRLAEKGFKVSLFEKSSSLVNGPPFCHLHAGGNMYREISEDQCVQLLHECIRTVRMYKHVLNHRPTCIAIPKRDPGEPSTILKRLEMLQTLYNKLVNVDQENMVLGDPSDYFKVFSKHDCETLRNEEIPLEPANLSDWLIPVVKNVDLEALKFPLVMVNELGWSIPRQAASATLALSRLQSARVFVSTTVDDVIAHEDGTYTISHGDEETHVDYLINACGYKTGSIDDFCKIKTERLVEFKAAYLCQWDQPGLWPEIVFHGPRGTPIGMAQYTPYADGLIQIHGMTEKVTLFKNGLVKSTENSSQPKLEDKLEKRINSGWSKADVHSRTQKSIEHMRTFIPNFDATPVDSQPLFGAQQIPGKNATLRAASVSFENSTYARIEIVKASSAISAADAIVDHVNEAFAAKTEQECRPIEELCPVTGGLSENEILEKALDICEIRSLPASLAKFYNSQS